MEIVSALVAAYWCGAIAPLFGADPASVPSADKAPLEPLPGFVSAPRSLPAVGRWQLARINPRGRTLAVAWKGDGTQIASSDETYIRICDAQSLETKKIMAGHSFPVTSLAWNGRTNRIASASCDGTVRIWSSAGVPEKVLRPGAGEMKSVAWTKDGSLLAAGSQKGIVFVWKGDGSAGRTIQASNVPVNSVDWSPDQSKLITGNDDGLVKLWAADGKLLRVCEGHVSRVTAVAWSPDGRYFASSVFGEKEPNTERHRSELRIYKADGSTVATNTGEAPNGGIAWSPDSQQIAIYETEGNLRTCDLKGLPLASVHVPVSVMDQPDGIAWAPKSQEIALGAAGLVAVMNMTDRPFRSTPIGFQGTPGSHPMPLAIPSPSTDQWLVRLSNDEPYRVWSAVDGRPGKALPLEGSRSLSKPAWSSAGDKIAFVESGDRLSVWRIGAASVQVVLTAAAPIYAFNWSPAGNTLAVIDQAGKVQIVRLDGSKLFERKFAGPRLNQFQRGGITDSDSSIPFGSDGKSIAIVERDAVEIIPLDGRAVKTFKFEASNVGSWGSFFWWSSDGSRLIAFRKGGGKGNAQLVTWNVATGERNTLSDFPDEVTAIDCSLDGKLAVLGYDTGFWQVRRLDDLKASPIESDPAVHFQTIRSVAFSQDGRRFATGGWDGLIKIWSAEGVYQQTLYSNQWPIHMLMWSPDGQSLASVSRDRTTQLASLKTGKLKLRLETTNDGATTLLTADGRLFGPSQEQLNRLFQGLVAQPSGQMEIISYDDLLKRSAGR